jgi:hypothetical protein
VFERYVAQLFQLGIYEVRGEHERIHFADPREIWEVASSWMDRAPCSNTAYKVSDFIHKETATKFHLIRRVAQSLGIGLQYVFFT